MNQNKYSNYYYKCSTMDAIDDLEMKMFQLSNPYGYSLDSGKRKIVDEEKMINKTRNIVKKKNINSKR